MVVSTVSSVVLLTATPTAASCTSLAQGNYIGTWLGSGPSFGSGITGSGAAELDVTSVAATTFTGIITFVTGSNSFYTNLPVFNTAIHPSTCKFSAQTTADGVTSTFKGKPTTVGSLYSLPMSWDDGTTGDTGTWTVAPETILASTSSATTLSTPNYPTTSSTNPIQVSVTSPSAAAMQIDAASLIGGSVSGIATLSAFADITAPQQSTATPLTITFVIDASALPSTDPNCTLPVMNYMYPDYTQCAQDIRVLDNGAPVEQWCPNTAITSLPDGSDPGTGPSIDGTAPAGCELSATQDASGNVTIVVLTTNASIWGFGVPCGTSFPFSISTANLPQAILHQSYSTTLTGCGGTRPYKFKKIGKLPGGLKLSSTGVISGVAKRLGTFSFSVRMTDKARPKHITTKTFSITVG